MDKKIEIILGLILLNIAAFFWVTDTWKLGQAALILLKGGLMWIIILFGAILTLLGLNELREKVKED